MNADKAMDFLNESPHVFNDIGMGVRLECTADKEHVAVYKYREGGIVVAHNGSVFRFSWSLETQQWAHWTGLKVGAS